METSMEIKQGFKKTKIGWIPEGWSTVKLGDVGEFKNGINKDKDQFGYGNPMINLNDIFELNKGNKNLSLVNSTEKEIIDYSLIKGDVLFVRSSVKPTGVGLTSLIEQDLPNTVFSGFIIRYRSTNVFKEKFKSHCFNSLDFRRRLLSKSTISANTNINQVALKSLIVALPPPSEQQKIAEILSTWDKAIEQTQTLLKQLKLRKKGLMQQLLTSKKRLSGFSGEWEEKRLGELIEGFTEKNKIENQYEVLTSSRNGLVPQKEYFGKNRITERSNIGFNIIPNNHITYRSRSDDGTFKFNINEFGFTGVISNYYPVFKMKNNYNKFFIELSEYFNHHIGRYSVGTSQVVLSFNALKKIKFKIPSDREQKAIEDISIMLDEEIIKQEAYLESLQSQKRGLMQQLLTGKTRVTIN